MLRRQVMTKQSMMTAFVGRPEKTFWQEMEILGPASTQSC